MAEVETIVAEPQAPLAEPIEQSLGAEQLDALLDQMRPRPGSEAKQPEEKPVAASVPAEVKPVEEKVATPAPPVSPFDPPPSVLGEVLAVEPVADEYGTMPEEPPPNFKTPKAKEEYKKWAQSHEKLKADLRTLREESKKAPKIDPGLEAQLADLTRRNEELNAIVERKAVEELPFVKQQFDDPRSQLFSIAAKALEDVDIPRGTLEKVLSLDGKRQVDALDDLYREIQSPSTREKVTNAIAQIGILEEKKSEFLADRKGNVERMSQAQKAEQYRQIAAQEKQMSDDLAQTIDWVTNKAGFEFMRKATEPGADKWNERVDNDMALINELALRNTDPKKLMTAIVLGVQAPHYRMAWQGAMTRAKAAEARVAELEGTLPKMNGNGAPEHVGGTGDSELDAAGVLPTDDLKTMARKLGAHLSSRQ